jgi:hypothetical protein
MTIGNELEETLAYVLVKISALQKQSGELPTQEFYPLDFPEHGWINAIQSPFITSCALISLLEIDTKPAKIIKQNGAAFIDSIQEKKLWRFWDNRLAQNKVPLDADDSALCSFALSRITGKSITNQKLFETNRTKEGLFYTWFLPRPAFIKNPLLYWQFMQDAKTAGNTIVQQMLATNDVEISVIANVLLYLGETEATRKSIDFIEDILLNSKSYEQHFYDEPIFTWYHVSRAYKYGVRRFEKLKPAFARYFKQRLNSLDRTNDLPLLITLANACYNFGLNELAEETSSTLQNGGLAEKLNVSYPYFTSKNRRYRAGSPALTLAWYAEYLNNCLRNLR